jgi:hypothetical protein
VILGLKVSPHRRGLVKVWIDQEIPPTATQVNGVRQAVDFRAV